MFFPYRPMNKLEPLPLWTGFFNPVSYTHLDVYKRQVVHIASRVVVLVLSSETLVLCYADKWLSARLLDIPLERFFF